TRPVSAQLRTLNCESNIHFQPRTLIAIGMVNGMTTRPRTTRRPLNGCTSRNASVVPRNPFITAAPTVKTSVLRTAVQNTPVSSAEGEFCRPTNRAPRAPLHGLVDARAARHAREHVGDDERGEHLLRGGRHRPGVAEERCDLVLLLERPELRVLPEPRHRLVVPAAEERHVVAAARPH